MSTLIFCCTGLRPALKAAQEAMQTEYPVYDLDRIHHVEPLEMRDVIIESLKEVPPEVDTLLVAQGFCGGSWEGVQVPCRTVIPRVDDCITIALQNTDQYQPNLKETGHLYVAEPDPEQFSPRKILENLVAAHGEEQGMIIFDGWFDSYHWLDIVDTGLYDCYDEEFVVRMQEEADFYHGEINFVPGGNRILEKLVAGEWDEQFIVLEPGETTRHGMFFD